MFSRRHAKSAGDSIRSIIGPGSIPGGRASAVQKLPHNRTPIWHDALPTGRWIYFGDLKKIDRDLFPKHIIYVNIDLWYPYRAFLWQLVNLNSAEFFRKSSYSCRPRVDDCLLK